MVIIGMRMQMRILMAHENLVRLRPVVHRMNEFPRGLANVHALVQGDGTPIPTFAGKFDGIAGGHFLDFHRVGPQSGAHAMAVLGSHRYRNDLDCIVEGTALLGGCGD